MEQFPNQESQERADLAEVLKTKGIEDKEVLEMLIAWTERKEQEVERIGTREAQLNFEMERAELYLKAGLIEEAIQALDDAYSIASKEGLSEYVKKIEEKIASI